MSKKAIVLLSGGIDSAVCAAIAIDRGYEVYALSFNYGQRHRLELQAAKRIADSLGIQHHTYITLPSITPMEGNFFPGRNTIFLSYALSYAETIGADVIYLGSNADDYNGFPDCRPEYVAAFREVARLATKSGSIRIETPLINMSKADIIQTGTYLGVDFSKTLSCYAPNLEESCGECGACKIRLKGFEVADLSDPIKYKVKC